MGGATRMRHEENSVNDLKLKTNHMTIHFLSIEILILAGGIFCVRERK